LPGTPSLVSQALVRGYAVQPRREGCLPPKAADPGKDAQENLLGDVCSVRPANHADREPVHHAVVAIIELPLGRPIPGLATRDDVGRVSYVELLVDGVRWFSTDDCAFNPIFGALANCYGLPRYDVERFYPNYPDSPKSGYMFTLDVGALLALGVRPGAHVLKVRVGDQQQTFAELPDRDGIPVTFICAERNNDFASIGYIDVPTRFDYISGVTTFQGWAFDENGGVAAVEIIIDGNYVGQAQYGFARPDVIQQHPEISPIVNTGWKFQMDTKLLSNARHQLTVRVLDAQGHRSEIGSQYFYVQNLPPAPELILGTVRE